MPRFMVRLTNGRRTTIEADFYDFEGDWVRFWNRPAEEGETWEQLAAARALVVQVASDFDSDSEGEES